MTSESATTSGRSATSLQMTLGTTAEPGSKYFSKIPRWRSQRSELNSTPTIEEKEAEEEEAEEEEEEDGEEEEEKEEGEASKGAGLMKRVRIARE